ncbi:hypothetical protein C8J56DRAFT_1084730 [Mycena floridula]|nr:hypothetical protein C8J56DRAFT_1084730 [Mycena floridula]
MISFWGPTDYDTTSCDSASKDSLPDSVLAEAAQTATQAVAVNDKRDSIASAVPPTGQVRGAMTGGSDDDSPSPIIIFTTQQTTFFSQTVSTSGTHVFTTSTPVLTSVFVVQTTVVRTHAPTLATVSTSQASEGVSNTILIAVPAGVLTCVIAVLIVTYILIRRRRRRRRAIPFTLPSDPESPVHDDQHLTSAGPPEKSVPLEAQSARSSLHQDTATIISSHSTATERQLELQQSSEALLARIASLEAERAASNHQQGEILEIIASLRAENERLKYYENSDWALGLTDERPPSYTSE